MNRAWDTDRMTKLRQTIEQLRKDNSRPWSWDEFILYLRHYKRRKDSTVERRIRQLEFMARHPAMPVKLNGSRDELVNSFCLYVTHREEVDQVPATTLVNDHKAIRTLGDFLAIPREVWPTMPSTPPDREKEIPSPEQVYELLHADYFPDGKRNPANALTRYLLAVDFGFGIRYPSEAWALKVGDLDVDKHILTVTMLKKTGRNEKPVRRRLLVEPDWLCCSKRHLSLSNWLTWRDKLNPETDAFFPNLQGRAFPTKFGIERFLYRVVRPRFPWFHPYLGRHWSVTARLIEWDFDYTRVSQWHGHDSVNMTKNHYDHGARLYGALYGQGWLKRAFEKPRSKAREAPANEMHRSEAEKRLSGAKSLVNASGPGEVHSVLCGILHRSEVVFGLSGAGIDAAVA